MFLKLSVVPLHYGSDLLHNPVQFEHEGGEKVLKY